MAKLTLIRHGQASFLADDYDHLSPLGEDQARRLGAHLAAEGLRPDRVFVGPLRRQRNTAALAAQAAAAAGLPWPDAVELDELREHQGDQLLRQHLPALLLASPELAALARDAAAAPDDHERSRAVARLLDRALRRWAEGATGDLIEPFSEFCDRVRRALQIATSGGRTVLAFTSAGVIGVAVGEILGASAMTSVELGMSAFHSSTTELLFTTHRVSLLRFNSTPHLDPPSQTQR